MILGLYRLATDLGRPFILHTLDRRRRRGKEETARIGERVGAAGVSDRTARWSGSMPPASGNRFPRCP